MRIIKKTIKNMKKRLALAECDIDLALKYKNEYPEYAKHQYDISLEVLNQFKLQHEHIAAIIAKYKEEGHQVPEAMQAVYDYLHEECMDYAAEIKAKQAMFR